MRGELDRLGIPAAAVAAYVKDVGSGAILLQHNAQTPFKPASIMKVLTTFAALEVLGPEYQWQTPVYIAGKIDHGILRGDLVFRGAGDPSLSYASLLGFADRLNSRGIRSVKGDVVIDKSYFGFASEDAAQFFREAENPWNVPPQPLLVDGKLITITMTPDRGSGSIRTRIDPPLSEIKLQNALTLGDGECRDTKDAVAIDVGGDAYNALVRLSGTLAASCGSVVRKLSVLGADGYFAAALRSALRARGGRVDGRFRDGAVDPKAKLLSVIPSSPLLDVLHETNKNSNNLMARLLLLTVGAELTGKPPTPAGAAQALQRWIGERVPDAAGFVVENGSGLSDQERVTAKGMVSLLDYIRTSAHAVEFLDTLPSVGEDGTMRNRLRGQPVAGRSVAKTGTLRDVRAIAGIVVTKKGRAYAFTMVVNHANAGAALPLIDRLIAWLHSAPLK